MTGEQLVVFGVLGAALLLFVWNRWRYDIVALLALLFVTLAGLVSPQQAFAGLGHPAVVTVAAVLVLSRGLMNAGVVDHLARFLSRVGDRPAVQVVTLTVVVALCSAFMNNVGALALLMPVAIWMARRSGRSPSLLLMPLAFGSLLGGTMTLIGTPPNLIVASYAARASDTGFGMFDFLPVGLGITLLGILFIGLLGWRLIPVRRAAAGVDELFDVGDYHTELRITQDSKFAGRTLHDLRAAVEDEADLAVVDLVRDGVQRGMPSIYFVLQEGDILLVQADAEDLKGVMDLTGLALAETIHDHEAPDEAPVEEGKEKNDGKDTAGEVQMAEVIVTPASWLVGKTATMLNLRERYGINVLAVARQGRRLRERLGRIRFMAGDILLVQGREEAVQVAYTDLCCLPLAERGLRLGRPHNALLALAIFGLALLLVALEFLPVATALVAAALAMVLSRLLSIDEAYRSIDLSIILLLAAMIPVGEALERTGGAALIAEGLLALAGSLSPAGMLALLMVVTMLLSNVVNNAAAAILMAPIGIDLARGLDVSADPFLMAVAIGASCVFLTPIGHQSSTLVMAPGGYRFHDYWRMGLPLSLIVVGAGVPLILRVWPL
ncbi:MAG: SLC13 family permease [Chromatiales bacterium]|nr:SLC13 family permease [Chromatiales bacterium]